MLKTLMDIQQTFRAKKDQRNDFGGFNYRNVEVMLTELKPILADTSLSVTCRALTPASILPTMLQRMSIRQLKTWHTRL